MSLLAKKFGVPVAPHVGDMGQLHQHLVLFNHVALATRRCSWSTFPILQQHFSTPCRVEGGVYLTPHEPGASCDLVQLHEAACHGLLDLSVIVAYVAIVVALGCWAGLARAAAERAGDAPRTTPAKPKATFSPAGRCAGR